MNTATVTTIDLDHTALAALGTLREAYDATWGATPIAANGAISLLVELAAEEIRRMEPFLEEHAAWLVAHTAGVIEQPHLLGRLLNDDINDSVPELGNPGGMFRSRIAALTITQDWALRMSLARYHNLRRTNPSLSLRDAGFPVG